MFGGPLQDCGVALPTRSTLSMSSSVAEKLGLLSSEVRPPQRFFLHTRGETAREPEREARRSESREREREAREREAREREVRERERQERETTGYKPSERERGRLDKF